jgi:SAM-dependent methyltransferase
MTDAPSAGNADQIAYWNAGAGETWAMLQDRLDLQLEPLGQRAQQALAPRPGERILDIGCGSGQTSLELARAVAPAGGVLGVDISRPLLEVARQRAAGLDRVTFQEADAETWPFEAETFDAAYSRFGVMFFADPVAAFRNIGRALRPGGRLAFVCWRTPPENVFMSLPLTAAASVLPPPAAPPPPPSSQGPFAFADPAHVRDILGRAGFGEIEIVAHDQKIGSGDLEVTLEVALKVGPLGAMLREHPDRRTVVIAAVRAAMMPHVTETGVRMDSASWIVTARRA